MTARPPQITVLMPVLNGMPYLPQALASLHAQDCRDFEVLLWDNGSTDGSVEEAGTWIPSRIAGRVITGEPLPLHLCLARMMEMAGTTFCARMDADDIALPVRFSSQLEAFRRRPHLAVVGGQCINIDAEGREMERQDRLPVQHDQIVTHMLARSAMTHPAVMFRRNAVLESGNYSFPKPVEDLDLYLRIVRNFEVRNLPVPVLKYRLHDSSVCHQNRELQSRQVVDRTAFHAPETYGISEKTYRALSGKQHPCSALPLLRSALCRARFRPARFLRLVCSSTFVETGRYLTGRHDWLSLAFFRILDLFKSSA